MNKYGFSNIEAAEYKAINHDIEEAIVQLAGLKIQKIRFLEKVVKRNGNVEIVRLIGILKERQPIHV